MMERMEIGGLVAIKFSNQVINIILCTQKIRWEVGRVEMGLMVIKRWDYFVEALIKVSVEQDCFVVDY